MQDKKPAFSPLGMLAVLWLLLVAGAYFVGHKPVSPAAALHLLQVFGWTAAALLVLFTAGGIGRRLAGDLPLRPAARMAVQAALGLGVMSLLFLVLGSWVGVSLRVAWPALLVPALVFRRAGLSWGRDASDVVRIFRAGDPFSRFIALLALLGMLATFLVVAAPPVKFDALVYHLALPQSYLDAGRIIYVPGNVFWGMPQVGEMLYTWMAALTGAPEAAAVLGWLVSALVLIGLLGYTTQRLGARAGWAAVGILLSGATLLRSTAWVYVDWFTMLYGLGVVVVLDAAAAGAPAGRRNRLLLAGVLAGLALSAKYTAGAVLLAGIAGLLFDSSPETPRPLQRRLAGAVLFSVGAVAAFSPWLLKNLIATGNPIYPFGVPAGAMTAGRLARYAGMPLYGGWENTLLLPWQAAIGGLENTPGFSASLGPLLLAFGALAGLGWRERPPVQRAALRQAAVFSIAGLVVWAAAGRLSGLLIQSRLYFALFPAFSVLAAAGFQGLGRVAWPRVRLGRIGAILLGLVLSLNLLQIGIETLQSGAPQLLLSVENRDDYLADNLGMLHLAMQAVQDLPEDANVLMLFEPRNLACAPRCDPDEILDRWSTDARANRHDPDRIIESWSSEGYTHLLYFRPGAEYFREDPRFPLNDWLVLDAVVRSLSVVVNLDSIYMLFELP